MSNKEPLHKCSGEDKDATKGTAIEATAAKIVEENTKAGPPDQTKVPQPINYAPMEGGRGPNLASTKLRCRKLNGHLKREDLLSRATTVPQRQEEPTKGYIQTRGLFPYHLERDSRPNLMLQSAL